VTRKRLLVLQDAARDLLQATAHYRNEAGSPTALRFAEAVRDTLMAIIGRPGIGSPRYAGPLNLLGLRSHPTRRFPYLVF
jgi:toxin ParE1/3/4